MPRYVYNPDGSVAFGTTPADTVPTGERDYVLYNQAGNAVDITITVNSNLTISTVDPSGRTGTLEDGDTFRMDHDGILRLEVVSTATTQNAFRFTAGQTSHGTVRSSGSGHTSGHALTPAVFLARI